MEKKKEETSALTEAKHEKVIRDFEKVIREHNLSFRNSTSLFREARASVFSGFCPTRTDL